MKEPPGNTQSTPPNPPSSPEPQESEFYLARAIESRVILQEKLLKSMSLAFLFSVASAALSWPGLISGSLKWNEMGIDRTLGGLTFLVLASFIFCLASLKMVGLASLTEKIGRLHQERFSTPRPLWFVGSPGLLVSALALRRGGPTGTHLLAMLTLLWIAPFGLSFCKNAGFVYDLWPKWTFATFLFLAVVILSLMSLVIFYHVTKKAIIVDDFDRLSSKQKDAGKK